MMKLVIRIAVFAVGGLLIFLGWRAGHGHVVDLQKTTDPTAYSPEMVAIAGAFLALAAFLPSPQVLGRWMSLKRRKPAQPAHFRRRHKG